MPPRKPSPAETRAREKVNEAIAAYSQRVYPGHYEALWGGIQRALTAYARAIRRAERTR